MNYKFKTVLIIIFTIFLNSIPHFLLALNYENAETSSSEEPFPYFDNNNSFIFGKYTLADLNDDIYIKNTHCFLESKTLINHSWNVRVPCQFFIKKMENQNLCLVAHGMMVFDNISGIFLYDENIKNYSYFSMIFNIDKNKMIFLDIANPYQINKQKKLTKGSSIKSSIFNGRIFFYELKNGNIKINIESISDIMSGIRSYNQNPYLEDNVVFSQKMDKRQELFHGINDICSKTYQDRHRNKFFELLYPRKSSKKTR